LESSEIDVVTTFSIGYVRINWETQSKKIPGYMYPIIHPLGIACSFCPVVMLRSFHCLQIPIVDHGLLDSAKLFIAVSYIKESKAEELILSHGLMEIHKEHCENLPKRATRWAHYIKHFFLLLCMLLPL